MSLSRRRFLSLSGAAVAAAATSRIARGCLPPPIDTAPLVAGNTAFAVDLYRKIAAEPGNLFLSPFSISAALAMTSAGAKNRTLAEMNKVLHLPEDPHPAFAELSNRIRSTGRDINRPFDLSMANAIWAQRGFPWRESFKNLTREHYGAGLVEADFTQSEAARAAINEWVEKETRTRVKNLIPSGVITRLTRMVLANAVYFKGNWSSQFKKSLTKDRDFHVDRGGKRAVPTMEQTGQFGYAEVDYTLERKFGAKAQLLELPYAGGDLSMVVMLPEAGSLGNLETSLSTIGLARWLKAIQPREVNVRMPRFKLEMEKPLKLNDPLKSLGMIDAFDDLRADFTGIHESDDLLYITHVLHKAFVDVNEEGTEAAAATGVIVGLRASAIEPEPTEFHADRPFLFLIRDVKTGGILFLGRVMNPRG